MKNSKWEIFLRGLKMGGIMFAGAAAIGVLGIGGFIVSVKGSINTFAIICMGAFATYGGLAGFTYGIKEAVDENKSVVSPTPKFEINNNFEENNFETTKAVEIKPIEHVENNDIKREFSVEKPKELTLKKTRNKF